jgi:hypothetical protein
LADAVVTVAKLAKIIGDIVGFKKAFVFDASKLDGPPQAP